MTVYDASGSLVGDGTVSGVGLPFLWKGIRLDEVTGLLYMRNRWYSVELGRFLSIDPLGIWVDRTTLGNAYSYGPNSPLTISDPWGLQADSGRGGAWSWEISGPYSWEHDEWLDRWNEMKLRAESADAAEGADGFVGPTGASRAIWDEFHEWSQDHTLLRISDLNERGLESIRFAINCIVINVRGAPNVRGRLTRIVESSMTWQSRSCCWLRC